MISKMGKGQRLAVSQDSLYQLLSERCTMARNLLATDPQQGKTESRGFWEGTGSGEWSHPQEIPGWLFRTRRWVTHRGGSLGINQWPLPNSAATPPWPCPWRSCQFGFPRPHSPSSHRWWVWFLCLRDASTDELVRRFWNMSVILQKGPGIQGPGLCHLAPMHPWWQTVHSVYGRKSVFLNLLSFYSRAWKLLSRPAQDAGILRGAFPWKPPSSLLALLSTYATPFERPYSVAMPNIKVQNKGILGK